MSTYILAFLAGLLSILSPCVLPLVPIVFASSLTAHRYGPAALAGGLSMSFVAIGMFMATIGFALGLNSDHFRIVAGLVMIMLGLLLLSQFLQDRFTILVTPLSSFLSSWFKPAATTGLWSQFGVGLLLGLESLRRPHIGRRIGPCLARQGSARCCTDHERFRLGGGFAFDCAQPDRPKPFQQSPAVIVLNIAHRQKDHGHNIVACRHSHRIRSGQESRSLSRRHIT